MISMFSSARMSVDRHGVSSHHGRMRGIGTGVVCCRVEGVLDGFAHIRTYVFPVRA